MELEIITQLGIGGFGIFVLWQIVRKLQEQNENHLHVIQNHQKELCIKSDIMVDILKDIRNILTRQ